MYFSVEKIERQLREIRQAVYRETHAIPWFKFRQQEGAFPGKGMECPEFDDRDWTDFRVGDTWGGYDWYAWFRAWVDIPGHLRERKLALRFLVGPRDGGNSTAETLLYVNGQPLQAVDVWHEEAWLPSELTRSGRIFIALRAWSGVLAPPEHRRFKVAELNWIDEPTEAFWYLGDTVLKSIRVLEENDLHRVRLLNILEEAFRRIDFIKPRSEAFYRSVEQANDYLQSEIAALRKLEEVKPKITGIGHAHIDMAWLWRLHHSREKASRTFSTALHLMRQYPEYIFMHSSPQLYKFLKQDYPEIYERVKERIAAGQWEVTGGMWVEADTNVPSGESLVRQFLFGRRFVREEFGKEMRILWLPDVFGYSWALPQILKKSGMEYFLTSKISWNQYNRFPYHTFNWRGIDGTEVLTYFVSTPEDNAPHSTTYNGTLEPHQIKGTWDRYAQKDVNEELLTLFGWGDGGGGPTKEMLETARALQNLPGMPKVELGASEDFMDRLNRRVQSQELPVWDGELYLEYHRGTYTSQAFIKRANRLSEILYHNAELFSAVADILLEQQDYPVEALHQGWERILLNQFHDILPGSSIRQVYEDCREDYERIFAAGQAAVAQAENALARNIDIAEESALVLNPLSWERDGLVELPFSEALEARARRDDAHIAEPLQPIDVDGQPIDVDVQAIEVDVQAIEVDGEKRFLVAVHGVPALGYRAFPLEEHTLVQEEDRAPLALEGAASPGADNWTPETGLPELYQTQNVISQEDRRTLFDYPSLEPAQGQRRRQGELRVTPTQLENRYYRLSLNEQGQITSLWDKQNGREVIARGTRGNVLQAFEDKPMNFDAWDIDIYYQQKMREVCDLAEARVQENGPLRGVLVLRWRFFDSEITQRLTIYRDSPRIDFRTEADWHEHQVLLKAAFPVDVRTTHATYDIQFGSIERPTHWNTSWDYSRFEVVGHKWADLSEGDYGVALLNDCKYGYDIKDNVMRLTLIKSAIHPDETADQGRHVFTYSLLPHAGDWGQGGVVHEAYELNNPLLAVLAEPVQPDKAVRLPANFSFAAVDAENVIVETVKKAEDDDAWVVRLYEYQNCRRSAVKLSFAREVRRAVECNLMEEGEQPVEHIQSGLTFAIAPFEIKTFKVWF